MINASVVIPLYNSESSIEILVDEINTILNSYQVDFILVNDCSTDNTHEKCLKLQKKFKNKLTYIKLKKNSGEHNAVMAGLNYAKGNKVFIVDDDFQNSPEDLKILLEYSLSNNYDVVYASYRKKKHNIWRNFLSKLNHIFANFVLNKPKHIYLSSFKSIDKSVVKKIINYTGPTPYIDGIIFNITSNIGQIQVNHSERAFGKSGYDFFKLMKLFSNFLFNFSTKPLHLIAYSGAIISLFSFIMTIIIVIEKLNDPTVPLGYTSIVTLILFFSGLQLFFIGLIGEYVGRVLSVVNKQPQYSIDLIFKSEELEKNK
jgi:undecaprenyl-phosphate 4-deoxy-4-formamido-L-arabinose transferase